MITQRRSARLFVLKSTLIYTSFACESRVGGWLVIKFGGATGVSFTSSNQKVPLISGLPGTRITLIARVCVARVEGVHLFRFRLFRSPVRDHEQRRGSCANRFVHKKAFAIHHIVFRSVRKPEQGNRLTEATLLEVNHWNSNDVPVVGSIKELLAVAAPSRVVTAAEGNLCTARGTRCEGPHDNFD